MCGIAGALGDLAGVNTAAMIRALGHRGPDDVGEERLDCGSLGSLWLGHTRLAIQDLSPAGHQPMWSGDRRQVVVFNGEIYNHPELRADLEAKGARFRSHSDTEVILAAYEQDGAAAVDSFRGMFAFALWDHPARTLLLARDRLGEKPLYYVRAKNALLFASEVRALLASGLVEREIDADGLDAYLTFGSLADPFTLVHGVCALQAGEVLTVRDDTVRRRRYWTLSQIEPRADISRDEAVERTRAHMCQSLKRSMVSDVPVALLLSGGIDSSSNVTLLAEQGWPNLHTFSVVFGGADAAYSEAPYSRLVADRFGTTHEEFSVGLDEAHALVASAVASMDQPSHDGVNTYLVCHAIKRAGIKVAVSGQGSDELFLGYPMRRLFPWFLRIGRLWPSWLKKGLAAGIRTGLVTRPSGEKALQALALPDTVAGSYLAQHSVFSFPAVERLRGRRRPPISRFIEDVGGDSPLDRLSRLELSHYLKNTLLRDGDQMSMAHAVEMRAPFLDSDLIQLVVSLPARYKIESGRNKPLLLDAVGPALPREVWDRPKMGFSLPYDRWIREGMSAGPLKGPEVGLDPRAVDSIRQGFLAGQYWVRYWTLQVLSGWARRQRMGTAHL